MFHVFLSSRSGSDCLIKVANFFPPRENSIAALKLGSRSDPYFVPCSAVPDRRRSSNRPQSALIFHCTHCQISPGIRMQNARRNRLIRLLKRWVCSYSPTPHLSSIDEWSGRADRLDQNRVIVDAFCSDSVNQARMSHLPLRWPLRHHYSKTFFTFWKRPF